MATCTHVVFDLITYPHSETIVPMAEAEDFHNTNRVPRISHIIWDDGFRSFAKAWTFSDTGNLARIGAGAYGDFEVWRHPNYDELARKARLAGSV